MSMKVVTYVDPFTLDLSLPGVPDLINQVQICATPSLKVGLMTHYGQRHSDLRKRLIESALLFDTLLGDWNGHGVRLRQYARLTHILAQVKQASPPGWEPHFRAFRRNQREVLLAIRLLAETTLLPADLKPQTVDEQIFQRVWEAMEQHDPAIWALRHRFAAWEADPSGFRAQLDRDLGKAITNYLRTRPNPPDGPVQVRTRGRLVLHGYYFITPLQRRFFELCDRAGMELIFLNGYDPRYPQTHRTWEAFFCAANGLPEKSQWIMPPALPAVADSVRLALAEMFEGREPAPGAKHNGPIAIRRYENLGAFVKQYMADRRLAADKVEAKKKAAEDVEQPLAVVYYGAEAEAINRFLREYYPEQAGRQNRHFLAYPAGQLLFHLHHLFDEENQSLGIDGRALFECFASGWVQTGGLNGRHYLRDLEAILPFFEGCRTLEEWKERAELLLQIRTGVVAAFNTPVPSAQPNRRLHQLLANPLERFAHFRVSAEAVRAIATLMEHLFNVARQLFSHTDIDMGEHLDRIEQLLLQGMDESELLAEEVAMLKGLRERLRRGAAAGDRFLPQDLAEAINLYLGGNLIEEEKDQYYVGALDRLDGAPLKDQDHPLHICVLGEKSLPKRKTAFPWPLTASTFAHLPNHPAVRMLVLREEESAYADRFLLHTALAWTREDVTLSWIANWQEETLGPSPYLVMLEPYCPVMQSAVMPWSAGVLAPAASPVMGPLPAAPDDYELLPVDVVAEYALCPRRYYYSFLAQEGPAFRSDFHHQFLFGNLARALAGVSGEPPEEVAAELGKLFPQWSGLLKQDLLERAPGPRTGYDRYDGAEYPAARYPLQFATLGRDEMQRPLKVFEEPGAAHAIRQEMQQALVGAGPLPTPVPDKACRFCPYIGRCAEALYPVDDEE